MRAYDKNLKLASTIDRRLGVNIDVADAGDLRRCELALQRWAERECGDGSDWAIERDEATGRPYNVYHGPGQRTRQPIPDREAAALKQAAEIAKRYGLIAYHQRDPRGCMLYLGRPGELTDSNYNSAGVACCD